MEYNIIFANEKIITKDFSKIPEKILKTIFIKIEELKFTWISNAHIKRLKNYELSNYRLRVGDYRILFDFDIEDNTIVIYRILHRSKLY